jgi:hypothetical protein
VRLGVHLPLADLGAGPATGEDLRIYTRVARDLGYTTLAANDHLVWRQPWLDGPTTLASVISAAGDMALATTIALPVVRHPVVVAKMLTTLACLAQGPVVGGIGPGSSSADYLAVGPVRRGVATDPVAGARRAHRPWEVLHHRGPTRPDTRPCPTGLVRQLGVRSTTRRDGGSGRWLVRLGVQRNASPVPGGSGPTRQPPTGCWSGTGRLPRCHSHHMAFRHRQSP